MCASEQEDTALCLFISRHDCLFMEYAALQPVYHSQQRNKHLQKETIKRQLVETKFITAIQNLHYKKVLLYFTQWYQFNVVHLSGPFKLFLKCHTRLLSLRRKIAGSSVSMKTSPFNGVMFSSVRLTDCVCLRQSAEITELFPQVSPHSFACGEKAHPSIFPPPPH